MTVFGVLDELFVAAVELMIQKGNGHCLVKPLLSWRSSVERLVWPLEIIIVAEGSEPARSAGCATGPGIVKPLNAHFQRLKPLFDLVAMNIVEITAQIGAS